MNDEMPNWKQETLARFLEWLKALPDEPPAGPQKDTVDLYALAEELTALKQEMRTLGRTTVRLADSSQAVSDTLRKELPMWLNAQTASPAVAPDREALQQARREAARPLLIELGDLSVALNELRSRGAEMIWPFYVPAAVRLRLQQTQAKPLDVLARRIHALLTRHALTPLVSVGDAFDAVKMNAAGTSRDGHAPPGCISAVVRQGFVCGEDVLRFAEVIIEEEEK